MEQFFEDSKSFAQNKKKQPKNAQEVFDIKKLKLTKNEISEIKLHN